jgi:hypothetical protein
MGLFDGAQGPSVARLPVGGPPPSSRRRFTSTPPTSVGSAHSEFRSGSGVRWPHAERYQTRRDYLVVEAR